MARREQWSLPSAGAWVRRGLRVSLGATLVLVGFGLIAARMSYARATDAAMDFGDELRSMGAHHLSGEIAGDAYQVMLNGQPVESSSSGTAHSLHDVLDYLQAECNHDAVGLSDKLTHLGASLQTLTPATGKDGFLVVRREQDDRGFVFCFAVDGPLSYGETMARLKRASTTGDFAEIGDVRYASVQADGKGAQVFTMWTHGSFNILTMFPTTGDAPGEDFGSVPRPEGSRRILSGTVVGAPFGVSSYEVKGAASDVSTGVNDKLLAAGFRLVPMGKDVPKVGRFYSLGDSMDVGVDVREARAGLTDVSYMVSRGVRKGGR